jgi:hypothetical protein
MANHKHEKRVARKDREHYVDNVEFYSAMCKHIAAVRAAEKAQEEIPQISDYIGECIVAIANKLANMPNFVNYPFREDMIADAIENCLLYINKFDPERSSNPFTYYTQTCWYAFLRRIDKEQTHLYTKYSLVRNAILHDAHDLDVDDVAHIKAQYGSENSDEKMNEFMEKFEARKLTKKLKKKA